MAKKKPAQAPELTPTAIEPLVHMIRGQRVMVDHDLARLYDVTTAALNQAVKRNAARFPEDFSFVLTLQELRTLISQNVISKSGRGGRVKRPRVFTEHGVAMLSSVLKSPEAVRVNIAIIRTFVRLRRLLATPGELAEQLTRLAETVKLHDHQIKAVADVLARMMDPPTTTRRKIGFHHSDEA